MTTGDADALPVWKMIYLARRNPQLAAADFPQAWREHSALGRQCTNVGKRVKAVAQCSRQLHMQAPQLDTTYDGVNLMVLADREAGEVIWSDPETLAVMRPDEPRVFADYVRNFSMLCREHMLYSGLPAAALPQNGQVILVGFLQRADAWRGAADAPATCPALWQVAGLGAARRIVCNTVDAVPPPGYGFRYIVEWWFDSQAQAAHAVEQLGATAALAAHPHGWGDSVFVLTEVTHSRP